MSARSIFELQLSQVSSIRRFSLPGNGLQFWPKTLTKPWLLKQFGNRWSKQIKEYNSYVDKITLKNAGLIWLKFVWYKTCDMSRYKSRENLIKIILKSVNMRFVTTFPGKRSLLNHQSTSKNGFRPEFESKSFDATVIKEHLSIGFCWDNLWYFWIGSKRRICRRNLLLDSEGSKYHSWLVNDLWVFFG